MRSGYNPLIPSPGDRIIPETNAPESATDASPETNMTKAVSEKISALISESDPNSPEITVEQIKKVVSESIEPSTETDASAFPEISKEDLKIKKANFKGMTEEEIAEKKKNDFADYLAGVAYVVSSNSPVPITSDTDTSSIISTFNQEIVSAITARDSGSLDSFEASQEKIMEQMKDITVPEDLADTHIETMRAIEYAQELKKLLVPNPGDPVADIANLAKIQGFSSYLMSFSEEMTKKFETYGLSLDDSFKSRLDSYGISDQAEGILEDLSAVEGITNIGEATQQETTE